MIIKIFLNLDGDAFQGELGGREIVKIIHNELTESLPNAVAPSGGIFIDSNGNRCGRWRILDLKAKKSHERF
jgi:hypothetical protein